MTVSESYQLDNDHLYSILGQVGDSYMLLLQSRKDVRLVGYDAGMRKKWDKSLGIDQKDYGLAGKLASGDKLHLFFHQRSRDSSILHHIIYDQNGDFLEEYIVEAVPNDYRLGHYLFTYSEGKNQVVFLQLYRNTYAHLLSYNLLDNKLNFEENINFENKIGNDFRILDIDDDGSVYLIFDLYNSRFRTGKHEVELLISSGKEGTLSYSIPYRDILFNDFNIRIDNKNKQLFLGGFYSGNSYTISEGYFITDLNLRTGDYRTKKHIWDQNIIEDIYGIEAKRKDGVEDLKVTDIELYKDGGAVLIGERQRVLRRRSNFGASNFRSPGAYVDYLYGDMLVISDYEGDQYDWVQVIHKRQFSQDDNARYSSYHLYKTPSVFQFLFNDQISNNSVLSGFYVDGYGQLKRTSILSTDYQDLRLNVQDAVQLPGHKVLIPSVFKSQLSLILVDFEN